MRFEIHPRLSPIFLAVFGRECYLPSQGQHRMSASWETITYSQADIVTCMFPSNDSFSNAVLQGWQNFGIRVCQCITCIEAHYNTDNAENGENMNLYLYHMAIKLEKRVL